MFHLLDKLVKWKKETISENELLEPIKNFSEVGTFRAAITKQGRIQGLRIRDDIEFEMHYLTLLTYKGISLNVGDILEIEGQDYKIMDKRTEFPFSSFQEYTIKEYHLESSL